MRTSKQLWLPKSKEALASRLVAIVLLLPTLENTCGEALWVNCSFSQILAAMKWSIGFINNIWFWLLAFGQKPQMFFLHSLAMFFLHMLCCSSLYPHHCWQVGIQMGRFDQVVAEATQDRVKALEFPTANHFKKGNLLWQPWRHWLLQDQVQPWTKVGQQEKECHLSWPKATWVSYRLLNRAHAGRKVSSQVAVFARMRFDNRTQWYWRLPSRLLSYSKAEAIKPLQSAEICRNYVSTQCSYPHLDNEGLLWYMVLQHFINHHVRRELSS